MARFDPGPGSAVNLQVRGTQYEFRTTEHPNAPGFIHAMEGAKGKVYSLRASSGDRYALKVMKPKHKLPELAAGCLSIEPFKELAGMKVCNRYCLTPKAAPRTVQEFPQLEFAILMPWIEGRSWFDVVGAKNRKPLAPEVSQQLARSFVEVVSGLEEKGAAHCDLSAGNIIMAVDKSDVRIELIDVEDIFAPGLTPPKFVSKATPGYQHRMSASGQWGPDVDRFSAAILITEMIVWRDPKLVRDAHGESFFDPAELQERNSRRYKSARAFFERTLPGAGRLLDQAWHSGEFSNCPKLSDWRRLFRGESVIPTQPEVHRSDKPSNPMPMVSSGDMRDRTPTSKAPGRERMDSPNNGPGSVQWGTPVNPLAPPPAGGVAWETLDTAVASAAAICEWNGLSPPAGSPAPQVAWQDASGLRPAAPAPPMFLWEQALEREKSP